MINVKGKTVVLTGTFASLPCRTDIVRHLRDLGATVKGSVDKNTDILFCGFRSGAKFAKAQELRVTVYKTSGLRQVMARPVNKPHYWRRAGRWYMARTVYLARLYIDWGPDPLIKTPTVMPENWSPSVAVDNRQTRA